MKKSALVTGLMILTMSIYAQSSYKTNLGVRIGSGVGIVGKHNLGDEAAIEGMVNFMWKGMIITGLYEMNYPVIRDVEGFRFYIGGGAHLGFWNAYKKHPWYDDDDTRSHAIVGIDGIIGLEYTFEEIPLNLSLDWKPMFNIADYTGFWGGDVGLSVRYTFK